MKTNKTTKFTIGQQVNMHGAKDAVIVDILRRGKNPMYQIEYTVDDEIERRAEKIRGVRRYTQPRLENEITAK